MSATSCVKSISRKCRRCCGLGVPASQDVASRQVEERQQGQFQGVLVSALSLASISAPLGFSSIYAMVRGSWPGAVWLSVAAVYAVAMVGRRRREESTHLEGTSEQSVKLLKLFLFWILIIWLV